MPRRVAAALLALALIGVPSSAASEAQDMGRVVVTITTLDGSVHMPGVEVELLSADEQLAIARSTTDGVGQVTFPDVPAGRYLIRASGPGFTSRDSRAFDVRAGAATHVLLDTPLAFVVPDVQVRAVSPSPTDSVQPVSASDILPGSILATAPLEGDDFRSLLPLLPGVVRDANGRLRIKGGQPTQGALQIRSASLVDPSSGEFELDLPAQSVDSVEVLANPFAAEYGRFTTSVTQIRTAPGARQWGVSTGNLIPRPRGFFKGVRAFEPRLSVHGPIAKDRLFLAQDMQFRYVAIPVKTLPDEPEIDLRSFDSMTRLDAVVSSRHMLTGGVIMYPREMRQVTMNTFRPRGATPDFSQSGFTVGGIDRVALRPNLVLETTVTLRRFEVETNATSQAPMIYAPESQGGGFFNDQERDVTSVQWVETLSLSRQLWRGEHVFKFGSDVQRSSYDGRSTSRPVEIRRLDGSLAERIDFTGLTVQRVNGTEIALFAQDRWRVHPRATLELGLRLDRDGVTERVNWSPRAGVALAILPEGRGILRGGYGRFVQSTPLNVESFGSFSPRTVSRFTGAGVPLGPPTTLVNRVDGALRTPRAHVGNVEWDQRFGRRLLFKIAALRRSGAREYILSPDPARGVVALSSTGTSRYRELELTARYLRSERRDLTVSYVLAKGMADRNNYDQFYGNLRNPILRPNVHTLIPTDVRHRLLVRGTIGLAGRWDFSPVLELRSGFPWWAVDEFQDVVGPLAGAGRLPAVRTLDFSLSRPWRLKKYEFRAGVRVYNVFGASAERDIQTNITSPSYGTAYNPIERSIGFVFTSSR